LRPLFPRGRPTLFSFSIKEELPLRRPLTNCLLPFFASLSRYIEPAFLSGPFLSGPRRLFSSGLSMSAAPPSVPLLRPPSLRRGPEDVISPSCPPEHSALLSSMPFSRGPPCCPLSKNFLGDSTKTGSVKRTSRFSPPHIFIYRNSTLDVFLYFCFTPALLFILPLVFFSLDRPHGLAPSLLFLRSPYLLLYGYLARPLRSEEAFPSSISFLPKSRKRFSPARGRRNVWSYPHFARPLSYELVLPLPPLSPQR